MKQFFSFMAAAMISMGAFAQLPDGSAAPDWTAMDINGVEHNLQSYLDQGMTVILDFSATWCGPCIRSFPNIREEVAHFKGTPVTFLGVTSLQGRVSNLESKAIDTKDDPAKEQALMPDFIKKFDMTWDVAFSEQNVFNDDYGVTGIPHLAIIAPDGTVRFSGLHPGDPASDVQGKVTALLKEFNLPVPN